MQARFFTLKRWGMAVAAVFVVAGTVLPQGLIRANISEDQLLADFARSLGFTAEMALNYANLLQAPSQSQNQSSVTPEYCMENYQDPECEQLTNSTSGDPGTQQIQDYINSGQPTPGNCNSPASCEAFCDNLVNTLTCLDFSKAVSGYNDLPPEGQTLANELFDPAKAAALVQLSVIGTTPGQCKTATQCLAYCENRQSECQNFLPLLGVEPDPVEDPTSSNVAPPAPTTDCISKAFNNYSNSFVSAPDSFADYFNNIQACITPGAPKVLGATTEQNNGKNKVTISLPTGQLLKVQGNPTIYYVNNLGLKIPKMSEKVFLSYGSRFSDVKSVSQAELDLYPTAQYIRLKGSEEMYRIDFRGNKYLISAQAKQRLGVQDFSVMTVNKVELDSYRTGEPIQE